MKLNKHPKQFILLSSWLAILFATNLSAQTSTKITVKAGESLTAVYKQMYRFPQFTYGKVYFMNNDSAKGMLNYNLIIGKMQFIDRNGDTLALSDNNPIKLVAIDTNLFYCNSGECVELIAGFPPTELAVSSRLKFADEQKIGAYGLPTSTQTIDNTNAVFDNNYQLLLNKDMVFTKETRYYFIEAGNQYIIANKKNLQKMFPKQKNLIEDYTSRKQVDFKNGSDLKDLFLYLVRSY